MASIWLTGTDLGRLSRWSDLLHSAGHDSGIVPITKVSGGVSLDADAWLYDLGMRPGADSVALLGAVIAHPGVRFVALTARPDVEEGLPLLRAGVRGYVNRLANDNVIEAVVSTVLAGTVWAGPEVSDFLLEQSMQRETAPHAAGDELLAQLTPREIEVALSVAAGHSNKVIASQHGVSERTVKAQLNSIFRKTGVRSRVQLALALANADPENGKQRLSNG